MCARRDLRRWVTRVSWGFCVEESNAKSKLVLSIVVGFCGLFLVAGGCPGITGSLGDLGPLVDADAEVNTNVDSDVTNNVTNVTNNYYGEHEVDPRLEPEATDADGVADDTEVEDAGEVEDDTEVEPDPVAADAGEDFTVFDYEDIRLDGSASEGDGLVYDWVQIGGPANLACSNRRAESPTYSMSGGGFLSEGTYEFELMVSDGVSHDGDVVAVTVTQFEVTIQMDDDRIQVQHSGDDWYLVGFLDEITVDDLTVVFSSDYPLSFEWSHGDIWTDSMPAPEPLEVHMDREVPTSWDEGGVYYHRFTFTVPADDLLSISVRFGTTDQSGRTWVFGISLHD